MTLGTESGVAAVPAAGGQGSTGEGQAAQPAQEVTVPLHVVERVRSDLSAAKEANRELEQKLQQNALAQQFSQVPGISPGQAAAPQAPPAQSQAAPEDPLEGLDNDQLVEAQHLRKVVEAIRNQQSPAQDPMVANLATQVARMQLQAQDPQYEETIKNYLPEMLNANSMWTEMIKRAPNPLEAAYAVAKSSSKYLEAQRAAQAAQGEGEGNQPAPDPLADLNRIIEGATRPGNPGSVGGGAGAMSGHDRYRNMSDADFDAEVARVMAGALR